jgi:hypothetical protein
MSPSDPMAPLQVLPSSQGCEWRLTLSSGVVVQGHAPDVQSARLSAGFAGSAVAALRRCHRRRF